MLFIDCSEVYDDPANEDECKQCARGKVVDCRNRTNDAQLTYMDKCFSDYRVNEPECQICQYRKTCKELAEHICFGKYDPDDGECQRCDDRWFCRKRRRRIEPFKIIYEHAQPDKSGIGFDEIKSEEYETENDRIKKELRTKRDSW